MAFPTPSCGGAAYCTVGVMPWWDIPVNGDKDSGGVSECFCSILASLLSGRPPRKALKQHS